MLLFCSFLQRKIANKHIYLERRDYSLSYAYCQFGMTSGPVIIKCPVTGCEWTYESMFDVEQSFRLIDIHVKQDHSQPSTPVAAAKAPKLTPPRIDVGVTPEAWQSFQIRWKQYCRGSQIPYEL